MKKNDSLKEIERRAYRSTFEDGIYDIQLALLLLIFAWIPALEFIDISRFYGYLFLIIPILIPWLGKRFITIPRLGSVEFGLKRKSKRRLLRVIGVIILFLILPVLIVIVLKGVPGSYGWLVIALFGAPIVIVATIAMDYPRMHLYVAVIFVAVVLSEFLYGYIGPPLNSLICFGLPGAGILLYGLLLLAKFMKKYPKAVSGANHAS